MIKVTDYTAERENSKTRTSYFQERLGWGERGRLPVEKDIGQQTARLPVEEAHLCAGLQCSKWVRTSEWKLKCTALHTDQKVGLLLHITCFFTRWCCSGCFSKLLQSLKDSPCEWQPHPTPVPRSFCPCFDRSLLNRHQSLASQTSGLLLFT